MVENPNYTIGDNNLSLGSLSLVKGTDYETYRDYSKLSAVPPRAIVYQIDLNGGSSTLTEARQVRPFASTSWINSSKYVWQANLSITDTNRFHQSWYFKYIPHKSGSFNASARFYYVYPVLPADETE
jgi:hypothetical protein